MSLRIIIMSIIKSKYISFIGKLGQKELFLESRKQGVYVPFQSKREVILSKLENITSQAMMQSLNQFNMLEKAKQKLIVEQRSFVQPYIFKELKELQHSINKSQSQINLAMAMHYANNLSSNDQLDPQFNKILEKKQPIEEHQQVAIESLINSQLLRTPLLNKFFRAKEEIWIHPENRFNNYHQPKESIIQINSNQTEQMLVKKINVAIGKVIRTKTSSKEILLSDLLIVQGMQKQKQFASRLEDPLQELVYEQQLQRKQTIRLVIKLIKLLPKRKNYYKQLISILSFDSLHRLLGSFKVAFLNTNYSQLQQQYSMMHLLYLFSIHPKIWTANQNWIDDSKYSKLIFWIVQTLHSFGQFSKTINIQSKTLLQYLDVLHKFIQMRKKLIIFLNSNPQTQKWIINLQQQQQSIRSMLTDINNWIDESVDILSEKIVQIFAANQQPSLQIIKAVINYLQNSQQSLSTSAMTVISKRLKRIFQKIELEETQNTQQLLRQPQNLKDDIHVYNIARNIYENNKID